MLREVALPAAKPGVVTREIHLVGFSGDVIRRYPCHPTTTNISLVMKPGYGVRVKDDDEIIGVKIRDEACPVAVTTEVPPTSTPGKPQEPPVASVALEKMTGAEKLAAGYKPVNKDGKIVWEK